MPQDQDQAPDSSSNPPPPPGGPGSPLPLTSEQVNDRIKDAWGAKGHAKARDALPAHRANDPFIYEPGAALMAALERAAPDPAADLDAIVAAHIESFK